MTTKAHILKTIRQNCIECMGNQPHYVEGCTSPKCRLFPFRMGQDPAKSEAKSLAARKRFDSSGGDQFQRRESAPKNEDQALAHA
jgi:hypothetical protein